MSGSRAPPGTYIGYDVFIHTAGQATYFSLDYTAPRATFWQLHQCRRLVVLGRERLVRNRGVQCGAGGRMVPRLRR